MKPKFSILFLVFCIFLNFACKIPVERRDYIVVTLEQISSPGSTFSYMWKGKRMTTSAGVFLGYAVGDRFTAYIDTLYPDKVEILYNQPSFYENEERNAVNGEILFYSRLLGGFKYQYQIVDKVMERFQVFDENFIEGLPKPQKGDIHPVEYWEPNPQRSIMHLGLPRMEE